MDFGVFNLMQQRDRTKTSREAVDDAIDQTLAAEELGFGRAWFAEHHFSNYSLCPSPLMMCAYAAGVTKKIRLGTAVVVPPLYKPSRLLGEIALADTLCDGRLDLGVGSGYQAYEFDRFEVDLEDNKEMMHEMLDMIELGLGNPHFTYEGKHYKLPQTAINVRPVQQPHPPIWLATQDPASVRRAARKGYTPFFSSRFCNLSEIKPLREHVDNCLREEGVDPTHYPVGMLSYGFVSDSKKEVETYLERARYQQRISKSLRERRETVVDDYWIEETPFANEASLSDVYEQILCGDVESVTERLVTLLREIRPSHITFYFQVGDLSGKEAIRNMERWATDVIPGVEKAFGKPLAEINVPRPIAAGVAAE
ncbi:MAG: LLM class flavin-dependent oxidoreductase [Alphaproteobacteria bacterium]|nr:LLM class flavin-dependent oxidoreductase [Alphaproteobacteria bacterium]